MDIHAVYSLIAAVILGGILGLERQLSGKPSGLRTIMLVTLGACAFVLSVSSFPQDSIARVVGQIVTGIGFLGAANIMKTDQITGTTTASMTWVSAAIGILTGLGQHFLASIVTCIVLLILLLGRLE